MDVSLVLTHRCNMECSYCYAGEHHRTEMTPAVRERAVELLFADEPDAAQLSFFGGEPFLAFPAMREAAGRARRRAEAERRRLVLQCTTNATALGREQIDWIVGHGMRICVSIDGVREAHELTRRLRGGRASFDAVVRGLRALLDADAEPDTMMVVTPANVGFLAQSVEWLWAEGVDRVRSNLDLRADWTAPARATLREQLLEVGAELVRQRRDGRDVVFASLSDSIAAVLPTEEKVPRRPHVVVGTSGHLYPCSPMVGEDRDEGPEAALRMGHIDEPLPAIVQRVFSEGLHCSKKGDCACASYIETGSMQGGLGPVGAEWKQMCREVGGVVGRLLVADQAPPRQVDDEAGAAAALLPAIAVAGAAPAPRVLAAPRAALATRALAGALAGAGALGFVVASVPSLLRVVHAKRACQANAVQCDQADDMQTDLDDALTDATSGVAMSKRGVAASLSQADKDAADLRARIAAKAAQNASQKKIVKKKKPPIVHHAGVMMMGDMLE